MHPLARLLLPGLLALGGNCAAQSVALTGVLGNKALLVIDGGVPKSVAMGSSHQGVKVLSAQGNQAEVEIGGARHTLVLGAAPVSHGASGGAASGDGKIVLHASSNGHFLTLGQINGGSVNFMVDTGASYVALGANDAARLGINLKNADAVVMGTANGSSTAWRVKLDSVRIGEITVHSVDGVVMPSAMPYVLLGNSFLTRFQMTRTNDQMVLERRY